MIPATLLLTVCVVYNRLAANHEVTAARAAGISVLSLMLPAFMLGTVLSVCSLLLTDQVIPWSVTKIRRTITAAMEDIFLENLRNHLNFVDATKGISITVEGIKGRTLIEPTFRYERKGSRPVIIHADESKIEFDLEKNEVTMTFVRAHVDIPGQRSGWFAREVQRFPVPKIFEELKPRHKSIDVIREELATIDAKRSQLEEDLYIDAAFVLATGDFERYPEWRFQSFSWKLENQIADHGKLRAELHSRFALACSCFFFVLLGSPFSIQQARKQFLTSFVFCFLPILLIYYPLTLGMITLSKNGHVDAAWGVWVGNALLLIVAAIVLRRTLRN
jgi:lipopolysaccharide export system permease protein